MKGIDMQKQQLNEVMVPCGCGRSQTGYCTGLHNMSEELYKEYVEMKVKAERGSQDVRD